jgi:CRP/FNR family transcriptional regulator, cyclic AMP receptor protein
MARKDGYVDHLAQLPLFSSCSKKDLRLVASKATPLDIPAGRTIIEEGAPGKEFFVIDTGSAVVKRNGRKVATLGPGSAFGELALLDGGPRTATVVAETDLSVLILTRQEFSGLLDEVGGLSRKLMQGLAKRLREADSKAIS